MMIVMMPIVMIERALPQVPFLSVQLGTNGTGDGGGLSKRVRGLVSQPTLFPCDDDSRSVFATSRFSYVPPLPLKPLVITQFTASLRIRDAIKQLGRLDTLFSQRKAPWSLDGHWTSK